MVAALVVEYLTKTAGVDPAKFEDPSLMVADLGLDSLGLVEMLFEVEDRCGFQLSDPMRFQFMSFKEMVAAIEASVRDNSGGELPQLSPISPAAAAK